MSKQEILRRVTLMAETKASAAIMSVDCREYFSLLSDLCGELRAEQQGRGGIDEKKRACD